MQKRAHKNFERKCAGRLCIFSWIYSQSWPPAKLIHHTYSHLTHTVHTDLIVMSRIIHDTSAICLYHSSWLCWQQCDHSVPIKLFFGKLSTVILSNMMFLIWCFFFSVVYFLTFYKLIDYFKYYFNRLLSVIQSFCWSQISQVSQILVCALALKIEVADSML